MKNVTDRTSNPFGMRPPFERQDAGKQPAVFGYGDANADFQVIGGHPGVHGGETTGVPFTETDDGTAVQQLFRDAEFVTGPTNDPRLENLFADYIHMCSLPDGRAPTPEEYAELERYFDAELRAINAHILLPVGERATDHVLGEYTTQRGKLDLEMDALHASEIRGRGFLVVPIRNPTEWTDGDRDAILETIESILASDYRQTKGVATTVG
ncbi:uracil DNA glycosylase [Halostagnicola larsenii XH-48]|uniref:Uracil DNA glycosylase n=1 Tax=Halostagnicola larsenii XH-48 TaxID=797299 RepID=W0JMT6_9EURY|nr:uracil-DNA glycosylase family protein [Halostagnicola larsenii]AHF99903.1 uracil DNA glycosylase [Halostagnicola larsenii XH-48]